MSPLILIKIHLLLSTFNSGATAERSRGTSTFIISFNLESSAPIFFNSHGVVWVCVCVMKEISNVVRRERKYILVACSIRGTPVDVFIAVWIWGRTYFFLYVCVKKIVFNFVRSERKIRTHRQKQNQENNWHTRCSHILFTKKSPDESSLWNVSRNISLKPSSLLRWLRSSLTCLWEK